MCSSRDTGFARQSWCPAIVTATGSWTRAENSALVRIADANSVSSARILSAPGSVIRSTYSTLRCNRIQSRAGICARPSIQFMAVANLDLIFEKLYHKRVGRSIDFSLCLTRQQGSQNLHRLKSMLHRLKSVLHRLKSVLRTGVSMYRADGFGMIGSEST